jgi:hypothetical protein
VSHRLFTILSALSLLLFVSVVVLWVRSYSWWDEVFYRQTAHLVYLQSVNGRMVVSVHELAGGEALPEHGWSGRTNRHSLAGYRSASNWSAVRWIPNARTENGVKYWDWVLSSPYTYPATAALVLPVLWLAIRVRQARRGRVGHCPSCGYDLRATPDLCPECGTVPAKART